MTTVVKSEPMSFLDMPFSSVILNRGTPTFTLATEILSSWKSLDFKRDACIDSLKRLSDQYHWEQNGWINIAAIEDGACLATNALLYPPHDDEWHFGFGFGSDEAQATLALHRVRTSQVGLIAQGLREMFAGQDPVIWREKLAPLTDEEFSFVFQNQASEKRGLWGPELEPGVYRREHSSLVFVSQKSKLLIDTTSYSPAVPGAFRTMFPQTANQSFDAVLLSHSHADHWHPPSIFAATRGASVPVIIPHSPKRTLLSQNLEAELRSLGMMSRVAHWGQTLTIGDFEIEVLPFYGEQPARDERWSNSDVRNCGNCYRISCSEFSVILLVDTGVEPDASMADVLRDSARRNGPVDAVLSCMRDFHAPLSPEGLCEFALVFNFEQLQKMHRQLKDGKLPSVTYGLAENGGLAEMCEIANARCFLPYSQSFEGFGQPIPAGPWGADSSHSENALLKRLQEQMHHRKIRTQVQMWNPGDRFAMKNGQPMILPQVPVAHR